jgi:ParB family transcriptional regulator, chromosome partitioning protein
MTATEKRRALGRGLDALLPEATTVMAGGKEQVFTCPIERLVPQKGQPRQHFDDARLEELAQSIREHGVIEPLIVRRAAGDVTAGLDRYEIIAGERRWRAAQKAGLRELLVVVKDVTPTDTFELALIENIQREDLNPLELAEALDRLIKDHSYTQEVLADRIGKDRTTIANSLRLLKLTPKVRHMVIEGALSEGHARALLGAASVEAMEKLAEKVARMGMSVRETERLVRSTKAGGKNKDGGGKKNSSVRDLEERLARHLGTRVQIADESGKGAIEIRYASLDELDRILDVIFK